MKTIQVTDEMHEFLINLSKELNTQNHRATAMPYFFQIQTQERVVAAEGCGTEAWVSDGTFIETDEEINEAISDYKEIPIEDVKRMGEYEKEEMLEEAGWRKINYDYEDRYENAFFTEKACRLHIKQNEYHYNKPVDYLSYASRNPELEMVMKFLCELTGGEI